MNTVLKERRQHCDRTQEEVADYARISTRQYQRIERGEQSPSVATAKKIAEFLHTNVESIF